MDELDIWIVPLMNPDGYVLGTRYNANGYDLNRNFPDWTAGDPNTTAGKQQETAVIMNWTFAHSFSLSANIHTGTVVANYPYDDDDLGSNYSASPDDDMFIYISEEYSQYNPTMWNSGSFFHGKYHQRGGVVYDRRRHAGLALSLQWATMRSRLRSATTTVPRTRRSPRTGGEQPRLYAGLHGHRSDRRARDRHRR